MKKVFTLLVLCTFAWSLQAQLANGTIAPDFTTTDLDGNEFNLYDKLEEGYTVILDFSATWCGPCWSYAQAGILDEVWEQYGPDGTQEIYVIKIEGDADTGMEDLLGNTASSQGNWLELIEHPIADDARMTGLYDINFWPTIYTVCPNRIITQTGRISTEGHYSFANNCLRPEGENNAGLLLYQGLDDTFCGEADLNPTMTLQNLGSETLTAASIQLSLDGEATETLDWTGNLAPYGLEVISFMDVTLTETTAASFDIMTVNGMDDAFAFGNNLTANATRANATDQNEATLSILTDEYGEETYWELLDGSGNALYTGGNTGIFANPAVIAAGSYEDEQLYEIPVVLPADGCYELVVYDLAGDGMCCGFGTGSYSIEANGEVIISGGEFGAEENTPFQLIGAANINNNAQIISFNGDESVPCGQAEYEGSIFVQNLGASDITSMQLSVSYDGGVTTNTVDWTGSIAPGQFGNVVLDAIAVSGDLDVFIEILSVNGEADTYTDQNTIQATVSATASTTNVVTFDLRTDFWPEEISWELRDSDGNLIDNDGNYPTLSCDSDFSTTFNLDLNECYAFTIEDSFSDGLFNGPVNPNNTSVSGCNTPGGQSATASGAVSLGSAQGVIFDNIDYGAGATVEFAVTEEVVSTQEITALEGLQLFPNPVSDQLTVRFNLKEASSLNVQVFNTVGQLVQNVTTQNFGSGRQQLNVDAAQLQSGVYFLRVQDGEQLTTRRFMVQR